MNLPGDIPAVSQRPPQKVLLWADDLTHQLQRCLRQQRRENSGGKIRGVPGQYLLMEEVLAVVH